MHGLQVAGVEQDCVAEVVFALVGFGPREDGRFDEGQTEGAALGVVAVFAIVERGDAKAGFAKINPAVH